MHPNKPYSIMHRFIALLLVFTMVFTGTVYADSAWEGEYLDVKDGTMTKGELYDRLTAQFGSGSYKYAESKPKYGWATGGTEVTSGNQEVVTLKDGQTYATGKKGRYTWTASTDYSFAVRVYYILTAADTDVTVANEGKVYAHHAAEIEVKAREGFHAQVWFDGKLQTTIEDGMTTGSFVPNRSGEVSVVYVEASKPKHNVTLNVIGEEFGSASLDFSGAQQEGTPITLTAVPETNGYIADITIDGAQFTTLSNFDANRGQNGSFDVATSDVCVTITFKEQTVGFDEGASYDDDGNLEVYINTIGAFDFAHIEETLYRLLAVDPDEAKPASRDLVEIKFLSKKENAEAVWRDLDFEAPTGDWAWLNPANGYAEFPQSAGETARVKISWEKSEQYPAGSIEQQIVLADSRIPTTIEGTDGTIIYGASDAEILEALNLQIMGADGTNPASAAELNLSYNGPLDVDGSPHTVKVSYGGNENYQPAKTNFKVTVKKAPCTITYDSQVVTYGDEYSFELKKNPNDVDTINFMIGLDGANNEQSEHVPVGRIYVELPKSLDGLSAILDLLLGDTDTVSLGEFLPALTKMMKNYGDDLEALGISTEAIETIFNTLTSVTEQVGPLGDIMVTINPKGGIHPTNIGVYLAGAVTADNNYETAYTVDYLVVVPKSAKADLKYNFAEINGIITQNLLEEGIYDLSASAYIDGEIHAKATEDISHLFLQVGTDGMLNLTYADSNEDLAAHVERGTLTKQGTYEQLSFIADIDNETYYGLPIARTYMVLADAVNVQFIDAQGNIDPKQEFKYDGQPKGMDVSVTMKNGTVLPNDEHLTVRYIGVDAKGIEFYHSTERPTNVGLYKVIATYIDQDADLIGMAAGTMTIEAGAAVLDVVDGTFDYDENYTVQVETTPAGMEKIVAIVGMSSNGDIIEGEVGMINVDLPGKLDVLMKLALPLVYYKGVNLQDLMDLIDQIKNLMNMVGLDGSALDQLTGTVTGLLDELGIDLENADITFKDTEDVKPLPIGMYTAVAISCDINHEIGIMDMGMITIKEKTIEQRKIIITAEDTEKTYGEKDPDFKWNYEVVGKTENDFYEGDDFEKVIVNGTEGVAITNMAGSDADAGVYQNMLYPQAYIHPDYQKYYSIEVKRGTLTVLPRDFGSEIQIDGIEDEIYTGYEIEQHNLVVKLGQIKLTPGADYQVVYQDNVNVGQASVTINGIGNYKGSASANFAITPKLIEDTDVSSISDKKYTGEAIVPEVAVVVDGVTLQAGVDYTLDMENNVASGRAKAVITGMGNYTTDDGTVKTVERYFDITPAELAVQVEKTNFVYDGTAKEPMVIVDGAVKDVDYTVSYENNINAGKGRVKVEGKGNYKGTFETDFNIAKAPLTISVKDVEKVYGEPNPEFVAEYDGLCGSDTAVVVKNLKFDCVAKENSAVGSYVIVASGGTAENYNLEYVDGRLTIKAKSLADAKISGKGMTYTGKPLELSAKEMTVVLDGVTLKEKVDFQVLGYENNVNVGKATIQIKGIGNYADTAKGEFNILPAQLPDADLEYKRTTFDGKAKLPKVTIKGLTEGVDFTVEYDNNLNAGTATVTITGIGNYSGVITKDFTIDKAKDSITFSISGWTYGDKANRPEGESASGHPITYQYIQGGKVLDDTPVNAGTYYVKATVADTENYTGTSVQKPFTIAKRSITDKNLVIGEIPDQKYTGQEVKPAVHIYDGYRNVELGVNDYDVIYRNNKAMGKATAVLVAKGNYKDSTTKDFIIGDLGFFASVQPESFIYNGEVQKAGVVADGYVEGQDYTVTYQTDCLNAGNHTVVISGIGKCINYGEETLTFYIHKADAEVTVKNQMISYGDQFDSAVEIKGLYGSDVLVGNAEFHYYSDESCMIEIDKPVDAGIYYVKASGFSAENYEVHYVVGNLVIVQADNDWITPLSMDNWTKGDEACQPQAEAKFGAVEYSYYNMAGERLNGVPTEAGFYIVKAVVAGTENYSGLESEAEFQIIAKEAPMEKAENAWVVELSMKDWTYGETAEEPLAEAKYGVVTFKYFTDEACTKEISKPEEPGVYYVKAYVAEGETYLGLESEGVRFVIAEVEVPTCEHDFEDGFCIVCGEEDPLFDANQKPDEDVEVKPENEPKPAPDVEEEEETEEPDGEESIPEDSSPDTGDNHAPAMWFILLITSLFSAGTLRKKRQAQK